MKKKRFTDEQIAYALRQAESGVKVTELCRKLGVSPATFYAWRRKYHQRTPRRGGSRLGRGGALCVHSQA